MIPLTRKERYLKLVMALSAVTYLIGGLAFVMAPGLILHSINRFSELLTPGLAESPAVVENKFWLVLAFSMMMTIAFLSYLAQHNVRKNKHFVAPVLIAKLASSVSALWFFIFSASYLGYLIIFFLDGSIFWVTLYFYFMANRAFLEQQTAWFRKAAPPPKRTPPTTVAVFKGEDKFALLDQILEATDFYDLLENKFNAWRQTHKKDKKDFSVVIKPNFMFMHSRKDESTYTDPKLVEYLVERIYDRGFTNIALVESQSTYGNYYANRQVPKVARYIGYSTNHKKYRLVDLTEEQVPHDYGGRLGHHFVGPTWRDADFRISFAKNKTHVFCHYTLTLKNIYGTLPMQDKLKEYHTEREYDWPTIEALRCFPVDYGLIDAFVSADGQFGVIVDPKPNHTKTIIGGENLIAVDWVGATKMGLNPDDPRVGRFLPLAVEAFGKPEKIDWVGDTSRYDPWENVSELFIQALDLIEEAYDFSNWWFSVLTGMDEYFAFQKKSWLVLVCRKILAPVKRLYFRHDAL
jgi:uncharacterized protein (DUF362 family)